MSSLSDLIIQHGRFRGGDANPLHSLSTAQLNDHRDQLTRTAALPAAFRALAHECRLKAAPFAGRYRPHPECVRNLVKAEAWDKAAVMAEQALAGAS